MLVLEVFDRYVSWLRGNVPRAYENLAPPATPAEIDALQDHLGYQLPAEVRAVLGVHNGQKSTDTAEHTEYATPCLPTLSFLSTTLIRGCWDRWNDLRDTPDLEQLQDMGDVLPGAAGLVKPLYTSPGWIPLWSDPINADYIGLDLDPDIQGTPGQIINFGRDEERHFVCAPDYTGLLQILLDEVLTGAWPATEMETELPDGSWTNLPWFGSPDDHFFNALHSHFKSQTT